MVLKRARAFLNRRMEANTFKKRRAGIENTLRELVRKGLHSGEPFLDKGLDARNLKKLGFNAHSLKERFGINAFLLRELGFSASEVVSAGFSTFSIAQAGFNVKELKEVNIGVQQLSALGKKKLLRMGFSEEELGNAKLEAK